LIAFAEEKDSDLIVIGEARDGIFGGHVITSLTAVVPTRAGDDNPLPFTLTLASAAGLPIRLVSLVSAASHTDADSRRDVLVVGSSRVAAPKRVFLGSTSARILAGTDAPVIVIPRGQ
jgi:nucleotide-binding universal stress UspA family protein